MEIARQGYEIHDSRDSKTYELAKDHIMKRLSAQLQAEVGQTFATWDQLLNSYIYYPELHMFFSDKANRIFSGEFTDQLVQSDFARVLRNRIGNFCITSEEGSKYPEVYWRISRPFQATDVGPLHADSWFWDLNPDWSVPEGLTSKRIKVWYPVQCEPGCNGLYVLPYSHESSKYRYKALRVGSKSKPSIIDPPDLSELTLLSPSKGEFVIFHDDLIHGGAPNTGEYPRISFEFTCLLERE